MKGTLAFPSRASGNPAAPNHDAEQRIAQARAETDAIDAANRTRQPGIGHRPDPIGFLEAAHVDQLQICDLLEEIADSLPQRVDRLKCFIAAGRLRLSVRLHQMDEDVGLFPILRERAELGGPLLASLDRLEAEHIEDEGLADDVIEGLEKLARGVSPTSVDGVAYMLRAFFDAHRRHIRFENEWVLPVARVMLDNSDMTRLEQVILRNRETDPRAFFPDDACGATRAALVPGTGIEFGQGGKSA
jgi:hemerythrin-like domain-containing protein